MKVCPRDSLRRTANQPSGLLIVARRTGHGSLRRTPCGGATGLVPIAWVVDGFRLNAELSAQSIQECFYPLYLAIGQVCGFAVGYDTNSDSLTAAVPGSPAGGRGLAWDERPLSLPLFCCLYLSVFAAAAVA